jgi:hypothetical protein
MASTKEKKFKQQEKAAPEVVKAEVKKEIPGVLHPDHLLQLEVKSRDIENAKLHMAIEEQALKNMMLELHILQRKVEDQKQLLKQKAIFYETNVKQFQQLKSELWPIYGFGQNEGLGYDPATGTIHRPNS